MKFKVMSGRHSEGRYPADHPTLSGKPIIYYRGDIVDSKTDLSKHNHGVKPKFVKMAESVPATKKTANVPPSLPPEDNTPKDEFDNMTVDELRAWADEEEIEIPASVKLKADLIQFMRNSALPEE